MTEFLGNDNTGWNRLLFNNNHHFTFVVFRWLFILWLWEFIEWKMTASWTIEKYPENFQKWNPNLFFITEIERHFLHRKGCKGKAGLIYCILHSTIFFILLFYVQFTHNFLFDDLIWRNVQVNSPGNRHFFKSCKVKWMSFLNNCFDTLRGLKKFC